MAIGTKLSRNVNMVTMGSESLCLLDAFNCGSSHGWHFFHCDIWKADREKSSNSHHAVRFGSGTLRDYRGGYIHRQKVGCLQAFVTRRGGGMLTVTGVPASESIL